MSSSERIRCLMLLATCVLAGCGFRLQGVDQYPESLATTYIDTLDRYSVFYLELIEELDQGGIEVVDSPVEANAVIRVTQDDTGELTLTVSGRNVPTELDVYYAVRYSVWINGEEVLPEQSLRLNQAHTYDANLVLGKARESQTIREALAANLVRQVSQQLTLL